MIQSNMIRLAAMAAAAVLFLAVLQNTINLKKIHRGRQILLPAAAVAYAVCGAVILYLKSGRLMAFLGMEAELAGIRTAVINLLLAAGFLPVKAALCPVVSCSWKNDHLMELTSSAFYEYDETSGSWFLKKEWSGLRQIVKAFFWCSVLLGAAMLFLSVMAGNREAFGAVCFPCAAMLILGEILGFLDGQTRDEFSHSVSGEGTDFRRISNYHRIREIYEKLFPKQFLSSHSGCEYTASQGAEAVLKNMEEGDKTDRKTAAFFRTYDRKTAFDPDCIQAADRLMHGENVVFFQPFYRDLEEYLTLPLLDTLLRGKNCLVIAGRTSSSRDAEVWITELLRAYTRLKSMWRVAGLEKEAADCEVGILDFTRMYDTELLAANRKFLSETGFVLMLEPSVMLNTGQIGISLLAEVMNQNGKKPVYCICDRRTDGLVDTISHLLQTEFVHVSAMPVPRCIYTGMTWNANGDYIRQRLFDRETRFLGNGIELAAVAVRNKIPQVVWYSETKAPLRDIRWIAGQYYAAISRYMNLPVQQKSLDEKVRFISGLWSTKSEKEQFVIAEDEFSNMFSTMRTFLSRGKEQSFVNILSENYMLRDYMRFNQQMFLTDPEAVPSLAPDYAKTDRNVLIKLILMMAVAPVPEQKIREELELAGCSTGDILAALSELLARYTSADDSVFTIRTAPGSRSRRPSSEYSIQKEDFDRYFRASLKNAYFVVEDEQREKDYVDAKLFGHITQVLLPGQFVVYDGKYYEVREVSPEYGIVLRRASDLYSGRRYYRQVRTYHLQKPEKSEMISSRKAMGLKLMTAYCSFSVETRGYLDMQDLNDLQTAKFVDFKDDPEASNYSRSYRNKRILCLELPGMDEDMRYTASLLLSELFRSVFPGGWPYLAVLAKKPESMEEQWNHLTYDLDGENLNEEIYIVEDSELDLGLLDSVIRNLPRMFEILDDLISWHLEKLQEQDQEQPAPVMVRAREQPERKTEKPRFWERILSAIFRKKKNTPENVPVKAPEPIPAPVSAKPEERSEKSRYQKEHFFLFGFEQSNAHLKLEETGAYFRNCGYGSNPLTRARKRENLDAHTYDLQAVNTCDFCGLPLTDVSYERLTDGRIRCNDCASSAVETAEEFKDIFYRSLNMMEILYGAKIHAPVQVRVADAAEVAKRSGMVFRPGTHFAARVVGFAQRKNGTYSIVVENGSPRLAAIDTMVHELTHIWQYLNWKDRDVAQNFKMGRKSYTAAARDILYEGMAIWAAVQYLYQIGETYYASCLEQTVRAQNDARGAGFRLYEAQYPLVKDMTALRYTPFASFPPLDPEQVKQEVLKLYQNTET